MNYANIKYCDIANGPGVRTSLFVSGCTHRCKGCFNSEAWSFAAGEPFTAEVRERVLASCEPDWITGLSLLGGEPMEPENQEALLDLVTAFRERLPQKSIWCYSGYTFEQLIGAEPSRAATPAALRLMERMDVLVDGEFIEDQHDVTLRFRGSLNQRILSLPASLREGKAMYWKDDPMFVHGR